MIRNQLLAIRATNDFVTKFDCLCERLGSNRSEIIRYALNNFFNDNFNNPTNFNKVKEDLF